MPPMSDIQQEGDAPKMTSGLPFDDIRTLLNALPGPDEAARARTAARTAQLSAQGVALGRVGAIAEWLAAWSGHDPQVVRPVVALFAGTHAISAHGVTPNQPADVQARVEFCAAGGAAVNQVCAANDLGLKLFDLALDLPVADITRDAALDERACAATMAFGMEAVAGGPDLVCVGDLGGGEVSAAAIMMALHGGEAAAWIDAERAPLVARAVELHRDHFGDPLEVLRRLGGREFAAIAGTILAARTQKIPVVLDGYVTTAAAAVLHAANPAALDHCVLGHISTSSGHGHAAAALGLVPLIDLSLGEGEGLGAALAAGLIKNAAAVHSGMTVKA